MSAGPAGGAWPSPCWPEGSASGSHRGTGYPPSQQQLRGDMDGWVPGRAGSHQWACGGRGWAGELASLGLGSGWNHLLRARWVPGHSRDQLPSCKPQNQSLWRFNPAKSDPEGRIAGLLPWGGAQRWRENAPGRKPSRCLPIPCCLPEKEAIKE